LESMRKNLFVTSIKYILVEVFFDILYFPIWWYSKGLSRISSYCLEKLNRRVGLGVWLKHLFVPMYGDYTKEGKIISFFMRLVVMFYKIILMFFWMLYVLIIFILWIILPVLFIYYIFFQIFNLPFLDRLL
jgi:hypothetical protein